MNKFTITLTKDQLDLVMEALGELPLKRSINVFTAINQQFIDQTNKVEKKEEEKHD